MGKASTSHRSRGASVSKKPARSTAVAEQQPRGFEGWGACKRHLRRQFQEIRKGSSQLVHVLACSKTVHGIEAAVNWYIGGNELVTMPSAVAVPLPGVYLVRAKFIRMHGVLDVDQWSGRPRPSLTHLRWLGARDEFIKMARCSRMALGKNKHRHLMQMLSFDVFSSIEVEELALKSAQSRAVELAANEQVVSAVGSAVAGFDVAASQC